MLIEQYFAQLEEIINACESIRAKSIYKEIRSEYIGYFKAELHFQNSSSLYIREFVFARSGIFKYTYSYHCQDAGNSLVFRYDNTRHFPGLPNFPHHKHTLEGVVSVSEPDLQSALDEILSML